MYAPQYEQEVKPKPSCIFGMALRDDYAVVVEKGGAIHLIKRMNGRHHIEASKNVGEVLQTANTTDQEGWLLVVTKTGESHRFNITAWLERHESLLKEAYDSDSSNPPEEKPAYDAPKFTP